MMQVNLVDSCGSDLSVVNAARVSFNKESIVLDNKDEKLINYLAKHKHFSPFNHTYITLRVKAPIFVARQLVKHEYMPWNEISRRYVDSRPELYHPEVWRGKPEGSIKQGSAGEVDLNSLDAWGRTASEWLPEGDRMLSRYEGTMKDLLTLYDALLESGVAPEQARMVLPQNMYTEWYWSGTIKAWAKTYGLRVHEGAQWESEQVLLKCGELIEPLFPVSWEALKNAEL